MEATVLSRKASAMAFLERKRHHDLGVSFISEEIAEIRDDSPKRVACLANCYERARKKKGFIRAWQLFCCFVVLRDTQGYTSNKKWRFHFEMRILYNKSCLTRIFFSSTNSFAHLPTFNYKNMMFRRQFHKVHHKHQIIMSINIRKQNIVFLIKTSIRIKLKYIFMNII